MTIGQTFQEKWLWYSLFCVLVWGPYNIVSKLGTQEIPAPAIQYLFIWGSLPVLLGLLAGRPHRYPLPQEGTGLNRPLVGNPEMLGKFGKKLTRCVCELIARFERKETIV